MLILERSKIAAWEQHVFKNVSCYGSFRYVPTLHKKAFSAAPVKCFLLYAWNNSYYVVFGNASFGEIKDHSLRTTPLQKNFFCYESLRYLSNLHKKVLSGAPVKCCFLYSSNNSDFVVLENAGFGEIKDDSLRMTPFQGFFLLWKF